MESYPTAGPSGAPSGPRRACPNGSASSPCRSEPTPYAMDPHDQTGAATSPTSAALEGRLRIGWKPSSGFSPRGHRAGLMGRAGCPCRDAGPTSARQSVASHAAGSSTSTEAWAEGSTRRTTSVPSAVSVGPTGWSNRFQAVHKVHLDCLPEAKTDEYAPEPPRRSYEESRSRSAVSFTHARPRGERVKFLSQGTPWRSPGPDSKVQSRKFSEVLVRDRSSNPWMLLPGRLLTASDAFRRSNAGPALSLPRGLARSHGLGYCPSVIPRT